MKKLMILAFLTLASAAHASSTIVCTQYRPNFYQMSTGYAAGNVRTVLVLHETLAEWGSSGSQNTLYAIKDGNDYRITRFGSSNRPGREEITRVWSKGSTTSYEMKDSFGGLGIARVTLTNGRGSANWTNDSGDKVDFEFCTNNVEE